MKAKRKHFSYGRADEREIFPISLPDNANAHKVIRVCPGTPSTPCAHAYVCYQSNATESKVKCHCMFVMQALRYAKGLL